jgi:hypothetical protein
MRLAPGLRRRASASTPERLLTGLIDWRPTSGTARRCPRGPCGSRRPRAQLIIGFVLLIDPRLRLLGIPDLAGVVDLSMLIGVPDLEFVIPNRAHPA